MNDERAPPYPAPNIRHKILLTHFENYFAFSLTEKKTNLWTEFVILITVTMILVLLLEFSYMKFTNIIRLMLQFKQNKTGNISRALKKVTSSKLNLPHVTTVWYTLSVKLLTLSLESLLKYCSTYIRPTAPPILWLTKGTHDRQRTTSRSVPSRTCAFYHHHHHQRTFVVRLLLSKIRT